jgi:CRISPR system Cascade subunit CasE
MLEMARLRLSPDGRRTARDPHALHRLLMRAFPPDIGGRAGAGLLHRVEADDVVLAQYCSPADWRGLGGALTRVEVRDVEGAHEALRAGQRLRFLLHANATFDAVVDGSRRRTAIRDADRQLEWLLRKLSAAGCRPHEVDGRLQVVVGDTWRQRGGRGRSMTTHQGVVFSGALVVDDPDRLRDALRRGVGRGRAYGFGLLTVAR